jgi:hypothetical protein
MKTDKLFWGIFLVFIGGIFLLENFDIIDFNWSYIWNFWPVILILIGVNILFKNSKSQIGIIITAAITVITLGLLTYKGLEKHQTSQNKWNWFNSDEENNNTDSSNMNSDATYSEEFNAKYQFATLNIKGGASKFEIKSASDKLFEASLNQTNSRYYLKKTESDSVVTLNFNSKGNGSEYSFNGDDFNEIKMMLNVQPVWDINLTMGAGEIDFNLMDYKLKSISLKGGAAAFKVKIGDLFNDVNLSAETGLAEIVIMVPETSGCRIKTATGLSSKDFKGFKKMKDGSFETSNYNTATNKINISLKGGLSDFNVDRY